MVADIFYPIFTLKITMLAYFIQKKKKKKKWGPCPHQSITLDPLVGLQLPFAKKDDATIFFLDYPLAAYCSYILLDIYCSGSRNLCYRM